MNDFEPFPCCDQNKSAKAIVFRDYKRVNPKGFYIHCFQILKGNKWIKAMFCPFCGKSVKKLACLV